MGKPGMNEHLSIYTFGGLTIQKDGQSVDALHSRKAQALLVYLAVTGRPQPREVLADLLWDGFSQQKAMNNLRVVLSSLRKPLEEYLLINRDTASMNPEMVYDLDVAVLDANLDFVGDYERKTGALNQEAITRIEHAVDLYKGGFLAGFFVEQAPEFESWMVVERERLHHIVLDGLGKLVRWKLEQGEYTSGIGYASRWIQLDSLSETAHRQMMRLLAFSGQRGEALKQYQRCREILLDELSVEPDTRTNALYEQIKNGEFVPDEPIPQPSSAVKPVQVETRHHNLPAQTTPFIGRERELSELDKLLSDPVLRQITVLGAGGMGKTRLVLEAAAQLVSQNDVSSSSEGEVRSGRSRWDGVFFLPLAQVSTPNEIVLVIAEQLEILLVGDSDPQDQILNFLSRQRLLLIFDSFEHLLVGTDLIALILQHAPNVTILVTSRERLRITGEYVYRLGELSYPEDEQARSMDLAQAVTAFGAVGLFLQHARLIRPDLEFEPDILAEVVRICRLVQGMPLAIILAVSWIETLSLKELADTIADNIDILASEQRDLPPRQRSIRAAFEASWQRLSPTNQAVFSKLFVFRGGFNRDAAQIIAGADIFILRTFIEKSLIFPVGSDRYELHELLRQFAEQKLADTGGIEQVQQAHSKYYLDTLNSLEADVKGQRQADAFKEINLDLKNITQAWFWALGQAYFAWVDSALESLTVFCYYFSRGNEGHELFTAAREKSFTSNNNHFWGRLLVRHAWLKSEYGIKADSIEADLDQSWAIFKQLDDQREIALLSLARGFFQIRIYDDIDTGMQEFEQAFQIYQALDERFYLTILLGRIGYCQVDPTAWFHYINQSLTLALETGNHYEALSAQGNLGAMFTNMGDILSAEQFFCEAQETASRIGALHDIYYTSNYLAFTGFLQGDLDQMKRYLPSREDIVIGKVTTTLIAATLAIRALLAIVSGEIEISEQLARQSLELQSNKRTELLAYWALAIVAMDRDNLAEASHWLSAYYQQPNITLYPGVMTRPLPVVALFLARSGQPTRAAQILSLATNHPASQIGWLNHWHIGVNLASELEQRLGKVDFQEQWDLGMGLDLAKTVNLLALELV
jgi:predicted ATPase/DNA-binding SARP family transcriptional activator